MTGDHVLTIFLTYSRRGYWPLPVVMWFIILRVVLSHCYTLKAAGRDTSDSLVKAIKGVVVRASGPASVELSGAFITHVRAPPSSDEMHTSRLPSENSLSNSCNIHSSSSGSPKMPRVFVHTASAGRHHMVLEIEAWLRVSSIPTAPIVLLIPCALFMTGP